MSSTLRLSSTGICLRKFTSHLLSPSLSRLRARTVLTDGGRRTSRAIRFAQCVEMPSPWVPADTLAHGDDSCCLPEAGAALEYGVGV